MRLSARQRSFWKKLQWRLRKDCPSPVKHTRVMIQNWLNTMPYIGWTTWNEKREMATIYIRRGASFDSKIDTLLHEWAHVVANTSEHDAKWSAAYGKCYRTLERLIGEQER